MPLRGTTSIYEALFLGACCRRCSAIKRAPFPDHMAPPSSSDKNVVAQCCTGSTCHKPSHNAFNVCWQRGSQARKKYLFLEYANCFANSAGSRWRPNPDCRLEISKCGAMPCSACSSHAYCIPLPYYGLERRLTFRVQRAVPISMQGSTLTDAVGPDTLQLRRRLRMRHA